MNGVIALQSETGKGTKFTIELHHVEKASHGVYTKAEKTGNSSPASHSKNGQNNNGQKIKPEIRKEFAETFRRYWEQVNEARVIDDLIAFGKAIIAFAEEKNIRSLKKLGKELVEASRRFEIDTIETLLKQIETFF